MRGALVAAARAPRIAAGSRTAPPYRLKYPGGRAQRGGQSPLLALILLAPLAACARADAPSRSDPPPSLPLPLSIEAAIPPLVDRATVRRDAVGCWVHAPDATPLTDAAGAPICN
ncbi:MAG: hypothetical protein ACU0BF_05520 [Paracoccaceae bacterium]